MKSKTDIINQAILFHRYLKFDYVSTARKISTDRFVEPIELAHTEKYGVKLWAKDIRDSYKLKQFDLEGIQEPTIVLDLEGGEK